MALVYASTAASALEAFIRPDPKGALEAKNGSINESRGRQPHVFDVKVILTPTGLSSSIDENTCSAGVSTDSHFKRM